ncbi:MAG: hypothetical protein JWR35_1107 [Marmoricola sp.]|jgi:hypothetical protein|nr:hypothetical protein [Marmoricola sp.]
MEGPDPNTPARRPDPAQLRISDEDRHKVSEILREAAGDGRIDLAELDERLEAAYAAKTYADLVPITLDLPAAGPAHPLVEQPTAHSPSVVVSGGPDRQHGVAIMSGIERNGVWTVPKSYTITCFMGGAELDLRQANFAAQEVVLTVNAIMGGADITVNANTRVLMEGIGIMGGYSGPRDDDETHFDANSPTVRVRGIALMGGVSVSRKPMPGEDRRSLRRRNRDH